MWGKGREGKGVGRGRGGGRGWKRSAHIERVYAPVELLDADILRCAAPLDAIKDHLLRLGRIVSAGFQEAPAGVRRAREKRKGARREMGVDVCQQINIAITLA